MDHLVHELAPNVRDFLEGITVDQLRIVAVDENPSVYSDLSKVLRKGVAKPHEAAVTSLLERAKCMTVQARESDNAV